VYQNANENTAAKYFNLASFHPLKRRYVLGVIIYKNIFRE
jgi:hypothetical protein